MKNDTLSFEEKKNLLLDKIHQLKVRSSRFDDINTIAKKAGLTSSNGFDSLASKISKVEGKNDESIINEIFEQVNEHLESHTALDSKRIYLYEVPKDELEEIKELFDSHQLFNTKLIQGNEKLFDYSLINDT